MAAEEGRRNRGGPDWGDDAGRYVMSVAVAMTGVDAHRIRKYEESGLVMPMRTADGQRLFSDRDIARIREVVGLEAKGVNLKGIEVILGMRDRERRSSTDDEEKYQRENEGRK